MDKTLLLAQLIKNGDLGNGGGNNSEADPVALSEMLDINIFPLTIIPPQIDDGYGTVDIAKISPLSNRYLTSKNEVSYIFFDHWQWGQGGDPLTMSLATKDGQTTFTLTYNTVSDGQAESCISYVVYEAGAFEALEPQELVLTIYGGMPISEPK